MEQQQSLGRELPEIEIAGNLFLFDLGNFEFREEQDPANKFSIAGFGFEKDTDILFDLHKKTIVREDLLPWEIPAHVKHVTVPSLAEIDPVGLARFMRFEDDFYVKRVNQRKEAQQQVKVLEQHPRKHQQGRKVS